MDFLDSLIVSDSALSTYRSCYKTYIEGKISPEKAVAMTAEEVRQIVEALHKKGKQPNTIKAVVKMLKRYAIFHGGSLNCKLAMKQLGQYTYPKSRETLLPKELDKVLQIIKKTDTMFYFFTLLAAHTGMRRGEVFGLSPRKFDFRNKRILISASHANDYTKTRQSRTVPMSPIVEEEALKYFSFFKLHPTDRIFTKKFDPNMLLQEYCGYLKIKKHITFHSLRHTFATLGLESNKVTLKQMQGLLGHAQLTTTLNMYWSSCPMVTDLSFLPGVQ